MKKSLNICLLCLLLAGCNATVNTGGVEGVIFPASQADFVEVIATAYWTPTESDIVTAMPHIKTFLAKQAPVIANRLPKYRCQYFGIIVEGKKIVSCNFFHRNGQDTNWQTKPIFVFDGGDWYFQLEYDVESKQCLNLQVNGEA
ncbi:MAG: hypothetical protein KAR11_03445 [Phycisphaerae bacterium]|nr:hypothetical protein [Phycisphaerae bacterium]